MKAGGWKIERGWYTEGSSVRIIFTEEEREEEEEEKEEEGGGDASLIRRRRGNEKWGIDGARRGRK